MKKIFLILITLAGIASATEVTLCQFKNGIGYANSKVICEEKSYTTIQDMYAEGWRYKGTFEIKDEAYLVMEKEKAVKCFVHYYGNIHFFWMCGFAKSSNCKC